MKTIIFIILLNAVSFAQWESLNNFPEVDSLTSVVFVNDEVGFISTSDGAILKTTNSGNDWLVSNIDTQPVKIERLFFVDELTGWAVGDKIYKTIDGANSWIPNFSDIETKFSSVYFTDPQNGYAFGHSYNLTVGYDFQAIWKTNNGNSWEWDFFSTLPIEIWGDEKDIWVTENNRIYKCGGKSGHGFIHTSSLGISSFDVKINSIYFINDNLGYAAGDFGLILRTTNAGQIWDTLYYQGTNLNDIVFIDSINGIAVGDNSQILRTMDGGNSWIAYDLGDQQTLPFDFFSVNYKSSNDLCVVGNKGSIIQSNDGGSTWVKYWRNNRIWSIEFCTDSIWWAVGENGTLLKSSDFGSSWEQKNIPPNFDLFDIDFKDAKNGFIIGYPIDYSETYLFITSNGGESWRSEYPEYWQGIKRTIFFEDSLHGWIGGLADNDSFIEYTVDGGKNWQVLMWGVLGPLSVNALHFNSEFSGWFLASPFSTPYSNTSTKIYNLNWDLQFATDDKINSIYTSSVNNVLAVGSFSKVYKTTDAGLYWTVNQIPNSNTDLNDIVFTNPARAWTVGDSGSIFLTNDAGLTWMNKSVSTPYNFYSVKFADPYLGIAVGDFGRIYRLALPGIYIDKDSTEFLSHKILDTIEKSFSVKNIGHSELNISDLVIQGSGFEVSGDKEFTIQPDDSIKIAINFTPPDTGQFVGSISIIHSAEGSPYIVTLSGVGLAPLINSSIDSIAFNKVKKDALKENTFIIRNVGQAELMIDSIKTSDNSFLIQDTSFVLQPNDSVKLIVTFNPMSFQSYESELKIYSDDYNGSPKLINLTGEGVGGLFAEVPEIDFGLNKLNIPNRKIIELKNLGVVDLIVDSMFCHSNEFRILDPISNATIKDSQSVMVTVEFNITSSGLFRDSITVVNDGYMNPFYVRLSGEGIIPEIVYSNTQINFEDVGINTIKVEQFQIINTGKDSLVIDTMYTSDNVFQIISSIDHIVVPSDTSHILVQFQPISDTTYNDELKVIHNSPNADSIINLSGAGKSLTLSTNLISFGRVIAKDSIKTKSVDVQNLTSTSMKVDSVSFTSTIFSANLDSFTVAPNSSKAFQITFTPEDYIDYDDTLKFYCSSIAPIKVNLKGTGFYIYPQIVQINQTYSFLDLYNLSSYKIIGFPGKNQTIKLTDKISGTFGTDWKAFWDNGADQNYLVESSDPSFIPGKAYWIVSKNDIVIFQSVDAVDTLTGVFYEINLNSGWTLISNPFDKSVSWSEVRELNKPHLLQPLWKFENKYDSTQVFEPYKGYYFKNTSSISKLKIPYNPAGASTSKLSYLSKNAQSNILLLKLFDEDYISAISISFNPNYYDGFDYSDIYSPPLDFQENYVFIKSESDEGSNNNLLADNRNSIASGQEYKIKVVNSGKPLSLKIEGTDKFLDYEIYLLDQKLKKVYNFKEIDKIEIKQFSLNNEYLLLVGDKAFINSKTNNLVPTEFSLYQNYPNPFNPNTVIRFALPVDSKVHLSVYNIVGEQVSEVIKGGNLNAGYYEYEFNASQFASGVYFYRLVTDKFESTKKMLLVK